MLTHVYSRTVPEELFDQLKNLTGDCVLAEPLNIFNMIKRKGQNQTYFKFCQRFLLTIFPRYQRHSVKSKMTSSSKVTTPYPHDQGSFLSCRRYLRLGPNGFRPLGTRLRLSVHLQRHGSTSSPPGINDYFFYLGARDSHRPISFKG